MVFWLYKKPHGNSLKYAMLLFAFSNILNASYFLLNADKSAIVRILASAAVCYCSGRLNRIDQNKYLMPVIGVVYFGVSIFAVRNIFSNSTTTILGILIYFNFAIHYLTLMIAYFVRYDEHKEAGLIDAPNK